MATMGLRVDLFSIIFAVLLATARAWTDDAHDELKKRVRERLWEGSHLCGTGHQEGRYAIGLQVTYPHVPRDVLAQVVIEVFEQEKRSVRTPGRDEEEERGSREVICWALHALVELDEPAATDYVVKLAQDRDASANERDVVLAAAAGQGRTELLPIARAVLREAVDGSGPVSGAFNVVTLLGDEDDIPLLEAFVKRTHAFGSLLEGGCEHLRERSRAKGSSSGAGPRPIARGAALPPTVPPNQDPAFAQDPSVGGSVSSPHGSSAAERPQASPRPASSQRREEGVSSFIRTFAGLGLLVVVVVVLIGLWKRR